MSQARRSLTSVQTCALAEARSTIVTHNERAKKNEMTLKILLFAGGAIGAAFPMSMVFFGPKYLIALTLSFVGVRSLYVSKKYKLCKVASFSIPATIQLPVPTATDVGTEEKEGDADGFLLHEELCAKSVNEALREYE